jgi:hypothetical protein
MDGYDYQDYEDKIAILVERAETAEAEARRVRGIAGLWCDHHGQVDGCGILRAEAEVKHHCSIAIERAEQCQDLEAEVERLRGLDEALHENCTLAPGHPTLKLLDEARQELQSQEATIAYLEAKAAEVDP